MAYRQQFDMKQPLRAAPPPPLTVNTNKKQPDRWADDLFANDPFSIASAGPSVNNQKKKPPPRPPPPNFAKVSMAKPDVPQRPAHFNRKPTILSNLMSKKSKPAQPMYDFHANICPPPKGNQNTDSGVAIASLIDLSSPPSSPTLTTRSSSDGLSVDSFGSDITSSTTNANFNGGNSSQAESGFEDDYDLFSGRKTPAKETDTPDSWVAFDPFSPPKGAAKVNVTRPVYDSDFLDPLCNGKTVAIKVQTHRIPTIIRAKPARPKAPKNSSLLTTTLANDGQRLYSDTAIMVRDPYQIVDDSYCEGNDAPDDGSYSPPMPTVAPPPPPARDDCEFQHVSTQGWNPGNMPPVDIDEHESVDMNEEPYGIALYDFQGTQDDDLPFRANDKIRLLRQLNEEWLYGRVRCGLEGMFPANFIQIKVPLKDSKVNVDKPTEVKYPVEALYEFVPQQDGDLRLNVGSRVYVTGKMNDEWLYGESNGMTGQFPANYVDHIPSGLPSKTTL